MIFFDWFMSWTLSAVLQRDVYAVSDRREYDGDRYVTFCVGERRVPASFRCLETDLPDRSR